MMNHRVLDSDERIIFRRHYESFGIGTISDDYLENSTVRGFFNQNGRMVGGFIINKISSKSRYLSFIPKTHQNQLPICTDSIAEICCLWIDKEITSINTRIFIFWLGLLEAKRTKHKFIIAGTTNIKNKQIQQFVFPNKLWDGVATHGTLQFIHYIEIDKLIGNCITAIPKYQIYKIFRKLLKFFKSSPKQIIKNLGETY